MNNYLKKSLIISATALFFTGVGATAATYYFSASDVAYNESNVQDAIDDLYSKASTQGSTCILQEGTFWIYEYTGAEEVFETQTPGAYKLEVWGAQGESETAENHGGYGGYSRGIINLSQGEKLYINVGGRGGGAKIGSTPGGYNGGGGGVSPSWDGVTGYVTGGGGATHIATKSGLLYTLENSKNSIIIVAGGGGGVSWWDGRSIGSTLYTGVGGGGGGYIGGGNGGTQTSGAAFGRAAPSSSGSGGGGGYYGGSPSLWAGASGGSGYIGSARLYDKIMYCNGCTGSKDPETLTTGTTNVNTTPTSEYAKMGDGAAKITYLHQVD